MLIKTSIMNIRSKCEILSKNNLGIKISIIIMISCNKIFKKINNSSTNNNKTYKININIVSSNNILNSNINLMCIVKLFHNNSSNKTIKCNIINKKTNIILILRKIKEVKSNIIKISKIHNSFIKTIITTTEIKIEIMIIKIIEVIKSIRSSRNSNNFIKINKIKMFIRIKIISNIKIIIMIENTIKIKNIIIDQHRFYLFSNKKNGQTLYFQD